VGIAYPFLRSHPAGGVLLAVEDTRHRLRLAGLLENHHVVIHRGGQVPSIALAGDKEQAVKLEALGDDLGVLGDDELSLPLEAAFAELLDDGTPEISPAHVAVLDFGGEELLDVDTGVTAGLEHPVELLDEEAEVQAEVRCLHVDAVMVVADIFRLARIHEERTEGDARDAEIYRVRLELLTHAGDAVLIVDDGGHNLFAFSVNE
jgi:hypothetical protein